MRKSWLALPLIASLILGSCKITRPDQENYIFDGSKVPIEKFIDALKLNFHANVSRDNFTTPDNEPMRSYKLRGALANVTVISLGDDRCNTNAPFHTTFNDKLYEVDLVFNSHGAGDHEAAKEALLRSAQQVGTTLHILSNC